MDRALAALHDEVSGTLEVALIAVGGYGRGELSPHSDIDLLVVTGKRSQPAPAVIRGLLYPLWDAGWQVGHAVVEVRHALERAEGDLQAATALLGARLVAGSEALYEELTDRRARWIDKNRRDLTRRIVASLKQRHERRERAGWTLAPDLKDDIGALRDVHVAGWLGHLTDPVAPPELEAAAEVLLGVREALHAQMKRKNDRIRIDLQASVARTLGLEDADALMERVHRAARTIEFVGDRCIQQMVERILGGPRRSGSSRALDHGVRVQDGRITGTVTDVAGALRLFAAHARTGYPIAGASLEAARSVTTAAQARAWSDDERTAFVDLLHADHASAGLEMLDHMQAWSALMPEWKNVRGRAQHDVYHRYTVDGHSFITVEEVTRVLRDDPIATTALGSDVPTDTLYVAALLHDIGKGSGEDHSVAGERLARTIAQRMGFPASDVGDVAALVRHHLTLVDTATRRDLDDGSVIATLAESIGTTDRLRHLYVLTVADARSTGPEAWNDWKSALVADAYRKTMVALETGAMPVRNDVAARAGELEAFEPALAGRAVEVLESLPRSYLSSTSIEVAADEVRMLLNPPERGEVACRIDALEEGHAVVTVCMVDRPGTLARTAGVFALRRISVHSAQAYGTTSGLALQRFIVSSSEQIDWAAFEADLAAAYSGRLALEARLKPKAIDYRPTDEIRVEVRVLQDVSPHSTVVEVRGPDALGLLFALASGLADLDLDIHVAKIDTLGARVVDVFYVRTLAGAKLAADQVGEVERAIEHRTRALFST